MAKKEKTPKTKKEKAIAGFLAMGYEEKAPTSKYSVFVLDGRKMLVGKSGGLRTCQDGQPIASSMSITNSLAHKAIILVGENREIVEGDASAAKRLYALLLKVNDANPYDKIIKEFKKSK